MRCYCCLAILALGQGLLLLLLLLLLLRGLPEAGNGGLVVAPPAAPCRPWRSEARSRLVAKKPPSAHSRRSGLETRRGARSSKRWGVAAEGESTAAAPTSTSTALERAERAATPSTKSTRLPSRLLLSGLAEEAGSALLLHRLSKKIWSRLHRLLLAGPAEGAETGKRRLGCLGIGLCSERILLLLVLIRRR